MEQKQIEKWIDQLQGEIDNVRSGSVKKDQIPSVTPDQSGPELSDAAAAYVNKLVATIEPIQAGSGDPSPDNIRPISGITQLDIIGSGRNLFNPVAFMDILRDPEYSEATYNCRKIQLKPNTKYTIFHNTIAQSSPIILINYRQQVNLSGFYDCRLATDTKTYTTDSTGYLYIGVNYYNTTNDAVNQRLQELNLMIVEGEKAIPFQPYTPNNYSIPLGRTVYGGTLDVTTGELVVDRASVDLGSLEWG
jgi:hypothetical protein